MSTGQQYELLGAPGFPHPRQTSVCKEKSRYQDVGIEYQPWRDHSVLASPGHSLGYVCFGQTQFRQAVPHRIRAG